MSLNRRQHNAAQENHNGALTMARAKKVSGKAAQEEKAAQLAKEEQDEKDAQAAHDREAAQLAKEEQDEKDAQAANDREASARIKAERASARIAAKPKRTQPQRVSIAHPDNLGVYVTGRVAQFFELDGKAYNGKDTSLAKRDELHWPYTKDGKRWVEVNLSRGKGNPVTLAEQARRDKAQAEIDSRIKVMSDDERAKYFESQEAEKADERKAKAIEKKDRLEMECRRLIDEGIDPIEAVRQLKIFNPA